jgi:hypothetical protein
MTTFNVLIALVPSTLLVTGLLHSRTVLAFLNLPGGMLLRQIHTTAAYWLLPLIGVHLGLHWGMIMNVAKITSENPIRVIMARVLAFLFAAFGAWSSFDRDMFAKLFQGFSFDYWDEARPALLFFTLVLSIIAVYVFFSPVTC